MPGDGHVRVHPAHEEGGPGGGCEHRSTGAVQHGSYGIGGTGLPRQRPAGPRREDVALFNARFGAPGAGPETKEPRADRAEGSGRGSDGGVGADGDIGADGGEPGGQAPRSRTCTGVAAAAVVTVLAIVVAGQVADGPQADGTAVAGDDAAREGDAVSRSHVRTAPEAPAARAPRRPASLHERLEGRFPLRKDLALSGAFTTIGGTDKAPGRGTVVRYRVDVEKGLPLDGDLFSRLVHETLNDPRGWSHDGSRTFERVSTGPSDFVITLASPGTTDVWCAKSGLDTSIDRVSCDSASTERVMINAYRWARGASTFGDDMLGYRQMLINHEVGHRLGRNHEGCAKEGALAPVMMQQTKSLSTNGITCRANPWVRP